MAAPWRLERSLQSPLARTNGALQAKATVNQITEGSSVGLDELFLRHRRADRALAGTSVLALVLAVLALTYLLVTCALHLSKGFTVSSQQSRLLASNFPYENSEACQAPPGNAKQETRVGNTKGLAPEVAAAAALYAVMAAHGAAPATPAGQTRRRLPADIQQRVGRTLLLLEQPVSVLTPLLSVLRPDHCLALVRTLCRLAALELSAFSTIPPLLQPLRRRVAQVYVDLIEEVLTREPTAREAVRRDWSGHLRNMQLLLQRLALVPKETERALSYHYRMMMENLQRVCHWLFSQVLNVCENIKRIKTQDPSPNSDEAIFQQRRVLASLFVARRHQVLRCVTLRYWLVQHHQHFDASLVYDIATLKQARSAPFDFLSDRLNTIFAAVIEAGGTPTTQFAPLPPLRGDQQQHQQLQHSSHQFDRDQHTGPPRHHPPQAYGPSPIHGSPLAQRLHPLVQPLPQAPYMPPPPQPAYVEVQTPLPFDSAAQDSHFPAVNPDPQISGYYRALASVPRIHLPAIYYYSHIPFPPPSSSLSAGASFAAGLGASSVHSQPSSTSGQLQTFQASLQRAPTGTNQDLSWDDDDA
ncbi:hypothetical protein Emag_005244 [Eimeria magna]